jgi:hypothetical protein
MLGKSIGRFSVAEQSRDGDHPDCDSSAERRTCLRSNYSEDSLTPKKASSCLEGCMLKHRNGAIRENGLKFLYGPTLRG